MDFKKIPGQFIVLFIIGFFLFLSGCSNKEKAKTDNTFYIDLVNFTNDSLKQAISKNIVGMVSYYKNNRLEIIPINYSVEEFPDMHYFKNAAVLDKNIIENTKKIRIEFKGNFSIDSIKYSLQKFKYKNMQWVKTSDMGVFQETKQFVQPENIIKEFGRKIVLNTVEYSYN